MAVIRDQRYRARELYIITVNHGNYTNTIDVPEGYSAAEAAKMMQVMKESHKPLTEGTAVADTGHAEYRLWKLWGSCQREDMEQV